MYKMDTTNYDVSDSDDESGQGSSNSTTDTSNLTEEEEVLRDSRNFVYNSRWKIFIHNKGRFRFFPLWEIKSKTNGKRKVEKASNQLCKSLLKSKVRVDGVAK